MACKMRALMNCFIACISYFTANICQAISAVLTGECVYVCVSHTVNGYDTEKNKHARNKRSQAHPFGQT